MNLLARAIINGFGWKLGVELGRYVTGRMGLRDKDKKDDEKDKDENEKEASKGEEDQRSRNGHDAERAAWTVPWTGI